MLDAKIRMTVIPSVSEALRHLICANVPFLSDGTITFDSPADWDGAKENSISLYLHNVGISPFLRNAPPSIGLQQGSPDRQFSLISVPAPLVLDLTYMIVAYGSSGENEQLIANALASILDTCGHIPDEYVSATLRASGNDSLAVIPEFASIHEIRDLWAAFSPKTYHLTRLYRIPSVRIPSNVESVVDVVAQINSTAHVANGTDRQ